MMKILNIFLEKDIKKVFLAACVSAHTWYNNGFVEITFISFVLLRISVFIFSIPKYFVHASRRSWILNKTLTLRYILTIKHAIV